MGVGGISSNIIFLQPTAYLSGLLIMFPLAKFLAQLRGDKLFAIVYPSIIMALLIGPVQAVFAYNHSYKVVIEPEMVAVTDKIKHDARPEDVVAFYPAYLPSMPIYGKAPIVNNFYFSALTGLRSFFSVDGYSENYLRSDFDRADYVKRKETIKDISNGIISADSCHFLVQHGVSYVFINGVTPMHSECAVSFYNGSGFIVYKIMK